MPVARCASDFGTSAGSIVAATLAGGVSARSRTGAEPGLPATEDDEDQQTPARRVLGAAVGLSGVVAAPFAALALHSSTRPGALTRRAVLSRVPRGQRPLTELGQTIARTGVTFDGRLLVSAVDLDSGRRVMFGAAGAPAVPVAAAVEASCAIPGAFCPVEIDGRSYVDGGVWSPTNMDAVRPGRGDHVLCLNPTGSIPFSVASFTGALSAVSRSLAATEALSLRHHGARVTTVNPDGASARAMGTNLMSPSGRYHVVAAGLAQGRRLARVAPASAA